jgi:hypothetical protein
MKALAYRNVLQDRITTAQHELDAFIAKYPCEDYSPPTFSGHWREWHRGHGCYLDDTLEVNVGAAPELAP